MRFGCGDEGVGSRVGNQLAKTCAKLRNVRGGMVFVRDLIEP